MARIKNNLKLLILPLFLLVHSAQVFAQVTCHPNSSTGSGYIAFSIAGFDLEKPDCEHPTFGAHITQAYDPTLQRNVFEFHSHSTDDSDRCINFDRVRMEVKGGANSTNILQHPLASQSFYRWKFRINENFTGSSNFCHLFQNKAFGGTDTGYPILTVTARKTKIEIIHNGGDTGTDLGVLSTADLDQFRGKWVEVYIQQTHQEQGKLLVEIKDMISGNMILQYSNDDIDLWRNGAEFNRPKWGAYRKKNSQIKDEIFRFTDFCISEVDSIQCPSEAGMLVENTEPSSIDFIQISPNPTQGQICIELQSNIKVSATIFSANGKEMHKITNLQNRTYVNISEYNKGWYYVHFNLSNQNHFQKAFLVQ